MSAPLKADDIGVIGIQVQFKARYASGEAATLSMW